MSTPVLRARPRAPRQGLIAAIVAALLAAAFVVVAPPAHAASLADYVGGGAGTTVEGRIGTSGSWQKNWAGEMRMQIDGGSIEVGYCIDFHTSISDDPWSPYYGNDLPEVDWATSGIDNLDQVAYILNTYDSGSSTLQGSTDDKAAAIQVAIWHLTDGYHLRTTGNHDNDADVIANYQTILAELPSEGLPLEPPPSLEITPAIDSAPEGSRVGPFVVATTAASVTLDVPSGVEVVAAGTDQPVTSLADGEAFEVLYPGALDPVTVTAEATATVEAGRVFARFKDNGQPAVQRLILASSSTATTTAEVTASWTEVEEGSLTIIKAIDGSLDDSGDLLDDPSFEVTVSGPGDFSETVTLEAANGYEVTIDGLAPGEYTVVEDDPSPQPKVITYSTDGGVVAVPEGQTAEVVVTNTYYDGAAPRVELSESCEAGITGTIHNDGDLPVTFVVTIDGDEHDLTVEGGDSQVLDVAGAASVTVTAPGMEPASVSHDADACYELGDPTFTLECAVDGSSIRVLLDDLGELASEYDLYVDGELVESFTGDIDTTVPVAEDGSYVVEVRSGDTVVGSQTFDVDCAGVEGYGYERSCDGYTVTLAASGELPATFTVAITIDGETTVEEYVVEPGFDPVVVTGTVEEGAQARVVVTEALAGTLTDDAWTQDCVPPPPPPVVEDDPEPTAVVAGVCEPLGATVTLASSGAPSDFEVYLDGELAVARDAVTAADAVVLAVDGDAAVVVRVDADGETILTETVSFADCADVGGEEVENPTTTAPPADGQPGAESIGSGRLPRTGATSMLTAAAAVAIALLGLAMVGWSRPGRLVRVER